MSEKINPILETVRMHKRSFLVFISTISTLSLVVLAAGLSTMEFKPGKLLDEETTAKLQILLVQFERYLNYSLIIMGLCGTFVIVYFFFFRSKAPRLSYPPKKHKYTMLIQLILWIVAILLVRRKVKFDQLFTNLERGISSIAPVEPLDSATLVYIIPVYISYACTFLVIALICAILLLIWRKRQKYKSTLSLLAYETDQAIEKVRAGIDMNDVILHCYYEMNWVLYEHRGIKRRSCMTAREFENSLITLGLPRIPVEQLTRLFESVRYGSKRSGEHEKQQAISCLHAISLASRVG